MFNFTRNVCGNITVDLKKKFLKFNCNESESIFDIHKIESIDRRGKEIKINYRQNYYTLEFENIDLAKIEFEKMCDLLMDRND